MTTSVYRFAALVLAVVAARAPGAAARTDPFAFWRPTINLTEADRRHLDRGEPVAHPLSVSGREVALFAAGPVRADGDRLVAWIQQIEVLKQSRYVLAISRFSDPPELADLDRLTLDENDLSAIVECTPGDCGLKLTVPEITQLRRLQQEAGPDWKAAVQDGFRQVVLERVRTYLTGGLAALAPYANRSKPVSPDARFKLLVQHSPFLAARLPEVADALTGFPAGSLPRRQWFLYWSKERFNGKSIVRATHVIIVRGTKPGEPDALVFGKELFATHYLNASLGVTAIVRAEPVNYLVYLNRSEVDLVRGAFGGLVRETIEDRLKTESVSILQGLRQRLESGDPPRQE